MGNGEHGLLARVVAGLSSNNALEGGAEGRSLLHQAASAFARRPARAGSTTPTGFDPQAASLFEAAVEASYLVANADGEFDATERGTFEQVVLQACHNTVEPGDLQGLISDLADQLQEDGVDRRIGMLARTVRIDEHKHEVLRVAALMAAVSGGVDSSERDILAKLATGFEMDGLVVEQVLQEATGVLAASN